MLLLATKFNRLVHSEDFVEETLWHILHLFEDRHFVCVSREGKLFVGLISETIGEDWVLNFRAIFSVRPPKSQLLRTAVAIQGASKKPTLLLASLDRVR